MITQCLKKELKKYDWNLEYTLESNYPFYTVIFPNCKIIFYKNIKYSTIECRIFKDNNTYEIQEVLVYNGYNFSELFLNQRGLDEAKIIEQNIKIIYEKLLHLINGDFNSIKKINEHRLNTKKIQKTLGNTFVFDSSIYKKMIKGDDSWKDDLDSYSLSK